MLGAATRRLSLGVRLTGAEERRTGLPLPPAPPDPYDYPFHEFLVMELERGRLDALLLPDRLHGQGPAFEATTLLAAFAGATDRIGLVATAATGPGRADGLARRLASLDAVSAGRAGWQPAGADAATGECVDAAHRLWDAANTGLPGAPPALPQGRPVLFHPAGTSGERSLAARHADVVLAGRHPLDDARALNTLIKAEAAGHGRLPDDLLVWAGLTPLVVGRPLPGGARSDGGVLTGTAAQIADHIERHHARAACDGFVLTFPALPGPLVDFVDQVVPELWRRGLFPNDYAHPTLRANLGLPSCPVPLGAVHA
ncbi:LLM class flavin-dependent oxidoreductase [Streptomyces sp. NPDC090077]|uniref:LLM class flavin-dependent oxidoreductase n=1 Tax=Streptomyces sp. NPDC090077 TaxID=3365938 RepID=UPI0037FB4316